MKRVLGLLTLILGLFLLLGALAHPFLRPEVDFKPELLIFGSLFGLIFLTYGRRWLFNIISLDVLAVDPDHPALEEAKKRAHFSMPRFWDALEAAQHHTFIKFPMPTTEGKPEHIWAVVHSRRDDEVIVSLASDPVAEPEIKAQRFPVAIEDIEDWQILVSDQEIQGGFSVAAIARIARERDIRFTRKDRQHMLTFVDLDFSELL